MSGKNEIKASGKNDEYNVNDKKWCCQSNSMELCPHNLVEEETV